MTWTLDTNQGRVEVGDSAQLRAQLLDLHGKAEHAPEIALLNSPDGSCLGIGLGHLCSVLSYIAPGGWPAKHAVGDETEGYVTYQLAGQATELPCRCLVPLATAVDAAVHFFATRALDQRLKWEDD